MATKSKKEWEVLEKRMPIQCERCGHFSPYKLVITHKSGGLSAYSILIDDMRFNREFELSRWDKIKRWFR